MVVLSIVVAAPLISTMTRTVTAPFHPHYVRYICSNNTSNNVKVSRLDMDMELYPSKQKIYKCWILTFQKKRPRQTRRMMQARGFLLLDLRREYPPEMDDCPPLIDINYRYDINSLTFKL